MPRYAGAVRSVGTSAAATSQTVSSSATVAEKIRMVTVKYSASASVTVTITLNSGAGAGYDTLLQNITLSSATDGVWIPDGDLTLRAGDKIDVLCPSGGGAITSACAIYTQTRGD